MSIPNAENDSPARPVWKTIQWWKTFLFAQARLSVVLTVAYIGNWWPQSYQRNHNADPLMFWSSCAACIAAALCTIVVKPDRCGRDGQPPQKKIILLCREQTEEWKGWMQWAFIFYHYYRARYVYNEIRVFVSSYVWMTGFGNFLYFDKKKDFSVTRVVSMLVRINWFPLSLCLFLWVNIELYYVVPLHTAGFLMTYGTCMLQQRIEKNEGFERIVEQIGTAGPENGWISKCLSKYTLSRVSGILISLLLHIAIFETGFHNMIFFWSPELAWRFDADKHSSWQGIVCAMLMQHVQDLLQFVEDQNELGDCGATSTNYRTEGADIDADSDSCLFVKKRRVLLQRGIQGIGLFLILVWYFVWGYSEVKLEYNAMHPYILVLPIIGYVLMRNSTYYLTQRYSWFLEMLGRNTLETYVLQFHVFMCRDVQHILCLLPFSQMEANNYLMRVLNMLVVGTGFVLLASEARKATVSTQDCFIEAVNDYTGNTATEKASAVLKAGGFGASHQPPDTVASDKEMSPVKSAPSLTIENNIPAPIIGKENDMAPLKEDV